VEAFLDWVDGVDALFANEEEAALLSGASILEDQMGRLLERFPVVVIKQGEDGATGGVRGAKPVHADAVPVRIMDSTGAGDAFFAGFVAKWLQTWDLMTCLEAGNLAGAKAITRIGAQD
jgi:sugar/nucleoside kinase (ribokinase family)